MNTVEFALIVYWLNKIVKFVNCKFVNTKQIQTSGKTSSSVVVHTF